MVFTISDFIICIFFTIAAGSNFTILSTTESPTDLQKLTNLFIKLDQRLEYAEIIKESNNRLHKLELQHLQLENSLLLLKQQVTSLEKVILNLESSKTHIKTLPTNCLELKRQGQVSGMYLIQPKYSPESFMVLCDMETKDGGWTYFMNRFDGSQNFYLNWTDYKKGFGSLSGEFWLGLEHLHQLTGFEANELLVEMADFDGRTVYAIYNSFSIGSEAEGYPLKVLGVYSGNAGDSLRYHAGMKFTTQDKDQDLRGHANCALQEKGSWWYNSCTTSNLNAQYLKGNVTDGDRWQIMYWSEFRGSRYSLKEARMMVRPRTAYSSSVFAHISKS